MAQPGTFEELRSHLLWRKLDDRVKRNLEREHQQRLAEKRDQYDLLHHYEEQLASFC